MTIQEFHEKLRQHDWYYQMSDDQSVWRRGCREHSQLEADSLQSPKFGLLFEAYRAWVWLPPSQRFDENGQRKNEPQWQDYADG